MLSTNQVIEKAQKVAKDDPSLADAMNDTIRQMKSDADRYGDEQAAFLADEVIDDCLGLFD